ncbi:hypothetical protein [Gilvimarinus agarilyticus]|uniref:hypothetical protein n=1 Tax=Gilvimarinus agarilyticus TaxID=679259 RepID=UPI0006975741|nr:hypothetical protein [Gilvimarinus agarilyticus]
MNILRTTASIATLIALGVLNTACNDKPETLPAEPSAVTAEAAKTPEPVTESVMAEPEAPPAMASASDEKPFIAMTEVDVVTAEVRAINQETREVTLAVEGGDINVVVGEQVQNLGQVKVGDTVVAEYLNQLTLELVDGEGLEAGEAFAEVAERAEQGELPGMMAAAEDVKVFMVEAIDLDDNTFKLRDPAGDVHKFTARHPENLKLADVGDALIVTTKTAVAVEVMPAAE